METVVFVRGERTHQNFPWMFFHLEPYRDPAPTPVRLAFFDYPEGTLKIWNTLQLKRGRAPQAAPDSETPLTPVTQLRQVDGSLDSGPPRATVLSLYDWIKAQPSGSIRSLQIFSHSWEGGPVLWNSYEFDDDGTPKLGHEGPRDPHDADFRVRDFYGSNPLSGAEGRKFSKAFTSAPLIKLWGCTRPEPDDRRINVQRYMSAPRGSAGDAARNENLRTYLEFVGRNFPTHMAVRLGLPVWAAPFGWGSDYSTRIPTGKHSHIQVTFRGVFPPDLARDHWWRVSWFFRHGVGARFYADVFKARIDPTDYVEYKTSWYNAVLGRVRADSGSSAIETPRTLEQRLIDRIGAISPSEQG